MDDFIVVDDIASPEDKKKSEKRHKTSGTAKEKSSRSSSRSSRHTSSHHRDRSRSRISRDHPSEVRYHNGSQRNDQNNNRNQRKRTFEESMATNGEFPDTRPMCRYNGRDLICEWDEECTYFHPYINERCKYDQDGSGWCRNGAECMYIHKDRAKDEKRMKDGKKNEKNGKDEISSDKPQSDVTVKEESEDDVMKTKLANFKALYLNVEGVKSKSDSLLKVIKELKPTIIGLLDTRLTEGESFPIEGYETVFRNDKDGKSGGVLIAVDDGLKGITEEVSRESDSEESIWILVNFKARPIRIGLIDAPSDDSTLDEDLDVMHQNIEVQVEEAAKKKQEILMFGDFNAKIGSEINGNNEVVSRAGRRLLSELYKNKLIILNKLSLCEGMWTKITAKRSKSVTEFMIVGMQHSNAIESMIIDEKKDYTPSNNLTSDDGDIYGTHNSVILQMNWTKQHMVDARVRKVTKQRQLQMKMSRRKEIITSATEKVKSEKDKDDEKVKSDKGKDDGKKKSTSRRDKDERSPVDKKKKRTESSRSRGRDEKGSSRKTDANKTKSKEDKGSSKTKTKEDKGKEVKSSSKAGKTDSTKKEAKEEVKETPQPDEAESAKTKPEDTETNNTESAKTKPEDTETNGTESAKTKPEDTETNNTEKKESEVKDVPEAEEMDTSITEAKETNSETETNGETEVKSKPEITSVQETREPNSVQTDENDVKIDETKTKEVGSEETEKIDSETPK